MRVYECSQTWPNLNTKIQSHVSLISQDCAIKRPSLNIAHACYVYDNFADLLQNRTGSNSNIFVKKKPCVLAVEASSSRIE